MFKFGLYDIIIGLIMNLISLNIELFVCSMGKKKVIWIDNRPRRPKVHMKYKNMTLIVTTQGESPQKMPKWSQEAC
jgi:hypothetical protein